MHTVPKSKNKKLSPNRQSVAAGLKSGAIINKAEIAGTEDDKTQMKGAAAIPVRTEVTNEERHRLIAEAAYFRAERRNFLPGAELEDWLRAESEIETKLVKAGKNRPPGNA